MVLPIKFNDDSLMKDIPETATKFEYENIVFVISHPEKKEFDFLFINKEKPKIYYHMYQEKGDIYFHKTVYENGVKKHYPVDIEKMIRVLGNILLEVFSNVEKIYITDSRFINELVYFQTIHPLHVQEKSKRKVIFGQLYEVEEIPFPKINLNLHKLGFIFDEDNRERDMIFVKDENIFRLELKHIQDTNDLESIF